MDERERAADAALAVALGAHDPWDALAALASGPLPDRDLAAAAIRRYPAADSRRGLVRLLPMLGEHGDGALLRLLEDGHAESMLIAAAVRRKVRLPSSLLRRLAEEPGISVPLLDAIGLSEDPALCELVVGLLDEPAHRSRAALALGRLGDRRWTEAIAERLPWLTGLERGSFTAALELLDDRAAVPHLLLALRETPDDRPAGDLHLALVKLTGEDRLLPLSTGVAEYTRTAREVWLRPPAAPDGPEIEDRAVVSDRRARFRLDRGSGRISVGYDPPSPGSGWPRWNRSLRIDGERLYALSSPCGTCETTMLLLGWPARQAGSRTERLRAELAHTERLTDGLLDAADPLLRELQTGHYRVHLADLDLERVEEMERSWWQRRWEDRTGADLSPDGPEPEDWPGTPHFQLRHRVPGPVPGYGVVLPSQPLDRLDAATVAGYRAEIRAGRRPAALALAWAEEQWVQAEHQERTLVAVLLDGHHRLAAYAAERVPARLVLLARLEDDWDEQRGWGVRLPEMLERSASPPVPPVPPVPPAPKAAAG